MEIKNINKKEWVIEKLSYKFKHYLHLKGFRYVCSYVNLLLENDFILSAMSAYKKIANEFNVPSTSVERCIRYFIKSYYGNTNQNSQTLFNLAYKLKYKGELL